MGEIPMNYRAVVDTFVPDGSLYGSVFCDLGMDQSDEFYGACEKAQRERWFSPLLRISGILVLRI